MKGKLLFGLTLTAACAVAEPFKDGERAVVFGDSVTHHGYYVKPLQDFYYTRFPDANIRIWNCGVGGETAGEALRRFERDIVSRKPTSVTVLFGMNDVCVVGYQTNAPSWALDGRAHAAERFAENMTALKGMLDKHLPSVPVTWCTLVPWDDELKFEKPRGTIAGVTAGEKPLCDVVTELHRKAGGGFVDYYTPMLAYNRKLHAKNPYLSLSPDTIHPREPGGLFMMRLFLRSQGVDGIVSDVSLDAVNGRVAKAENAAVTDLAKTAAGGLAFTLKEKALPFPVEFAAKELAADVGFDDEFNREMLQVKGLSAGDWTLRIDGTNALVKSAAEWAKGFNLALCEATPMMAQARAVAALNETKREKERAIRSLWVARCVAMRRIQWEVRMTPDEWRDDRFATAFIQGFLNARPEKHPDLSMYRAYAKDWRNLGRMEDEVEQLHRRIRGINRPRAHRFEFVPAGD